MALADTTDERHYRVANHDTFFETDIAGLAETLDELLGAFLVSASGIVPVPPPVSSGRYGLYRHRHGVTVSLDGYRYESEHLEPALNKLLRHLSYAGITSVRDRLVIHAGVVSREGCCAVLPAPSGSGKTTLTAALVQRGWQYLSDEAALVELETGLVHPFPRPLGLSPRSLRLLGEPVAGLLTSPQPSADDERHLAPEQLRPGCIGAAAPLRLLVAPRYRPGSDSRAEPLRRSEALLAVITNSVNFASFGQRGLDQLAEVVRGAQTYRLEVDDLEAAVAELGRLAVPLRAAGKPS